MNPEKKESRKYQVCDWCSGDSSLNIGPGYFRDFDSDFSYGIPICGGCGGLGIQFDTKDFRNRTNKIMELRFEYCPGDPEKEQKISKYKKYISLKNLISEAKDLVKEYGYGVNGSLAEKISQGLLDNHLEELKILARQETN